MESNLYRFILRHSLRQQGLIVLVTLASLPIFYLGLELPKWVINIALDAAAPDSTPLTIANHVFFSLDRVWLLVALSLALLAAVVANGIIKYRLNLIKGRLGEKLLQLLRHKLCDRLLNFPPRHYRRVSAGEVITMITGEAEPLGGFISEAIALPVMQIGTLLTALFFIFMQDHWIGLAAVSLFPLQLWLIPRLRRRILELGRARVREVRRLSTRIEDAMNMAEQIRAQDATGFELKRLDSHLELIFGIRYEIFRRKFLVKFLNNFLFQFTPFLLLLIGGLFIIHGRLSVGALVAVLAAYRELPPPAKELLDFYQSWQDVEIKYEQIIIQFASGKEAGERSPDELAAPPLVGAFSTETLTLTDDEGRVLVENLNLNLPSGEHLAVFGEDPAIFDLLSRVLVGLEKPQRGFVQLAEHPLPEIGRSQLAASMGWIDAEPSFITGTVLENLYYGWSKSDQAGRLEQALYWLEIVELESMLVRLGLSLRFGVERPPDLARQLLAARQWLREQVDSDMLAGAGGGLFDQHSYCRHATVLENLTFSLGIDGFLDAGLLATDPGFHSLYRDTKILHDLVEIGHKIVTRDTETGAQNRDPINPSITQRSQPKPRVEGNKPSRREKRTLLVTALGWMDSTSATPLIPPEMERRIVASRHLWQGRKPGIAMPYIAPLDPLQCHPGLSVLENFWFARLPSGMNGARQLEGLLNEALVRFDLRRSIATLGLDAHLGPNGNALMTGERQRLALARALIREPSLLIADRATAALNPGAAIQLLQRLREVMQGRSLVWLTDELQELDCFERVIHLTAPGSTDDQAGANTEKSGI